MSLQDFELALLNIKLADTLTNNENQTTVGTTNVYPDPTDRDFYNLDAHWGDPDHDSKQDGTHYSTGVKLEFHQDREALLDRIFNGMSQASAADKSIISQMFEHGKPGQHESHSPLLTRKTAAAHVQDAPTLSERVRAVAGRR